MMPSCPTGRETKGSSLEILSRFPCLKINSPSTAFEEEELGKEIKPFLTTDSNTKPPFRAPDRHTGEARRLPHARRTGDFGITLMAGTADQKIW
jgi:hypothetical protein